MKKQGGIFVPEADSRKSNPNDKVEQENLPPVNDETAVCDHVHVKADVNVAHGHNLNQVTQDFQAGSSPVVDEEGTTSDHELEYDYVDDSPSDEMEQETTATDRVETRYVENQETHTAAHDDIQDDVDDHEYDYIIPNSTKIVQKPTISMNDNMAYGRPISSIEDVETDVNVAYGQAPKNAQELQAESTMYI